MPTRRTFAGVRRDTVVFVLLAYLLSWSIEVPLALQARGLLATELPAALHYLASFGPMLAALIVAGAFEGRRGVAGLLAGLGRWRVGWGYAGFAVAVPTGLFLLAGAIAGLQGHWPDLSLLGQVDDLPYLGVAAALALWLATFGLGEEAGWRGFALPRLQEHRSAWQATLIVAAVWGFWHLPAFFYRETYLAMGVLGFPVFLVSILAASVVFTWLYNGTGGSLLAVIVFHALFDFFSVTPAGGGATATIMSVLIVGWALVVMRRHGPASLAPGPKVTPSHRARPCDA